MTKDDEHFSWTCVYVRVLCLPKALSVICTLSSSLICLKMPVIKGAVVFVSALAWLMTQSQLISILTLVLIVISEE